MLVYRITNTVNGKVYVGITTKAVTERWADHLVTASKSKHTRALYNAIKKYGADVFSVTELASASSMDELQKLEREFIVSLNSMAPHGYNMTFGGEGVWGYRHTEETKRANSIRSIGRRHTPEAIEKIRATSKGRKIPREAVERSRAKRLGVRRTPEQCMRISVNRIGKGFGNQSRRTIPIDRIQLALAKIAAGERQSEIAVSTGLSPSYVSNLATGKRGRFERRVS